MNFRFHQVSKSLYVGFMITTAFISMWITNTATTAMMTPIMEAVLKQLDKQYDTLSDNEHTKENGREVVDEKKHEGKMVLLSFCKHCIAIFQFQKNHGDYIHFFILKKFFNIFFMFVGRGL